MRMRQTPFWLAERLRRAGLRPISAAGRRDQLRDAGTRPAAACVRQRPRSSGDIVVRHARAGEKLKLLDEREVTLDPEFLLIADDDKAVSLAGVMGGYDSRVTD